jgi:hypothetical protein
MSEASSPDEPSEKSKPTCARSGGLAETVAGGITTVGDHIGGLDGVVGEAHQPFWMTALK